MKLDTIKQRLIQQGEDISSPDFVRQLNAHVQAAQDAIPRPVNPADETMPESFQRTANGLHAFGRVGTLLQVVAISGGIGPIINLGLIVTDTVRLHNSISFFEHSPVIAWLLAIVTIFSYTYLAFIKADLKYLLRKNEREVFSWRRVRENMNYWLGRGTDWKPRMVSQSLLEYRRITRFYTYVKGGIFVLLVLAAGVEVFGVAGEPLTFTSLAGAVGSIIITMILLQTLDLQVDRAYKTYMSTEGTRHMSVDFFEAQLESWQQQRVIAGEEAMKAFYALALRNVQERAKLTAQANQVPQIEPEIILYTNGHKPAETIQN